MLKMNAPLNTALLLAACVLGPAAAGIARAAGVSQRLDPAQIAFFERKIRPILVSKCYSCHATDAKEIKGGLVVDSREGIRKGGKSGAAVVPGNLDDSLLIDAIRWGNDDLKMPPKQKLPDEVIADFEKWVEMGAPDTREKALKTAGRRNDADQAKTFWAFQPPRMIQPKPVADSAWPRNEIDRYILAGLEAKDLQPAPDADKTTLLRRVYYDLIGLPPTPQAIEAFVNDTDPKAFEKAVDELLASPRFGERWGRYWLDVARYAESTGKDRNYTFPQAWRYRDYVIASFNADKPYDQFIKEQIAGDLMSHKDFNDRNDKIIATGFLAMGTKSLNEKSKAVFRNDLIDDQIDVTTKAVMALTVACARCHDHKFDPISMKDYYSMAGIFLSTQTYYGTGDGGGNGKDRQPSKLIPLATSAATVARASVKGGADLPAINPKKNKKKAAKKKPASAQDTSPGEKESGAGAMLAMGVLDGSPGNSPIYGGGEVENKGPEVPRGFVAVLNATAGSYPIPTSRSGRMELAMWLTSSKNPLTARVMVNRIWQHLFGQGIVKSADNFGMTGDRPSHPELLDYLAIKLTSNKWSTKQLIRMIVLSRTYQQSNKFNPAGYEADPENQLVWHANERRLDAEALRDSMLQISGSLDLVPPKGSLVNLTGDGQIGKGIRPEKFSTYEAGYRSVYMPIVRDAVPKMLALFDFAEPGLVVTNRETTNVPAQALFMLNNPFVYNQAEQAAKRLLSDSKVDPKQRVTHAYLSSFGRSPTDSERAIVEQYLRDIPSSSSDSQGNPTDPSQLAWTTFFQAMMGSAEFRYLR